MPPESLLKWPTCSKKSADHARHDQLIEQRLLNNTSNNNNNNNNNNNYKSVL